MILRALLMLTAGAIFGLSTVKAQDNLPVLTQVAQIRKLTAEQARRGYPVKLHGVIPFNVPLWG